ncbi:esterase family protein [Dyadobacter sp. NIV53]|uniref:alpha/beta hydrolase n=1 Tax=Dyadobacter sp. NIV53 TaxID=2861765 RepID=UPI001E370821|nr:alpha/beta hydrolase-fold protein [Dyadobacter sp. NIV53]
MDISHQQLFESQQSIFSAHIKREVTISIILPQNYSPFTTYTLLIVNDGQDFPALGIENILKELQINNRIHPVLVAGVHAGADRIYEYGTSDQPDYANRGNKAGNTRDFILHELLPHLRKSYSFEENNIVYAGFSLGGLMALDIAWNQSHIFSKTAVFSGALWWRKKAIEDGYNDADRIMHAQIRDTAHKPDLKFWFQCGGKDETDDRDGDGIIDSIQDTLECIAELERKGYAWNKDISYLEMPYGEHNIPTWSLALPEFLVWAFGVK